jgi:hypothetical protein
LQIIKIFCCKGLQRNPFFTNLFIFTVHPSHHYRAEINRFLVRDSYPWGPGGRGQYRRGSKVGQVRGGGRGTNPLWPSFTLTLSSNLQPSTACLSEQRISAPWCLIVPMCSFCESLFFIITHCERSFTVLLGTLLKALLRVLKDLAWGNLRRICCSTVRVGKYKSVVTKNGPAEKLIFINIYVNYISRPSPFKLLKNIAPLIEK